MENNLIEQNTKALCISGVVRSIFKEIQIDQNSLNKQDRHTEEFKEGFKEAVRTLAIIIKQETEIDVRK